MRADTLILNGIKRFLTFPYFVAYDMMYLMINTAAQLMCFMCEIPSYIDFCITLCKTGVEPLKNLYKSVDTGSRGMKSKKDYFISVGADFKVNHNGKTSITLNADPKMGEDNSDTVSK